MRIWSSGLRYILRAIFLESYHFSLTLENKEIPVDAFEYFQSTFDFLKRNNVNLVMASSSSPITHTEQVLHIAGAHRISGSFHLHKSPMVLNYLADHNIPLELGLTRKFENHVSEIRTFTGNPIRLYFDNYVPVTICSFHHTFCRSGSRMEPLYSIVQECNLSISEVLKLFHHGLTYNFQSYPVRMEMAKEAWRKSEDYLSLCGFKHLHKKYFW